MPHADDHCAKNSNSLAIDGVECGRVLAAGAASRGVGDIAGLGLCMGCLVDLQYMGTLPTVHRYVLFIICYLFSDTAVSVV